MSYANGITNQQQTPSSINSLSTPATSQPTTSAGSLDQSAASNPNAEPADLTSLSAAGGLVAQSLEGSDIRSGKVAALQQAIVGGTYNVSSSAVADKIMQSLLE
jgi:negative regulator of flagellin synthesis FlgM